MSSEWPIVRLRDHVDACLGKMLDAKKNKGTFQPYLGNSNVRWGVFDLDDLAEMRFEPHEEERYGVAPGDLVVCEGGEPGRYAIWTSTVPGMKIQKALHRIRPKETLNNYYLYYWFCHSSNVGLLDPYFTGTTTKHLTGKAIAALQVPLPPVEAQTAMVDVLKSLDDRIALLRETNATLEAIAQALFKSWFVNFDPVRAKAEGREPEGIPPEIATLFPREFVDSVLGEIPKGWQVMPLADACEINPTRRLTKGKQAPYLEMSALPTQGHCTDTPIARAFSSGTKFINGDTLLARITPCLENGKTAFVDCLLEDEVGWGSTEYIVLRPKAPLPNYWAYLLSRHEHFRQYAIQAMVGTSGRQRVDVSRLAQYLVAIPDAQVSVAFAELVEPLQRSIAANDDAAKSLAALRDPLLPRLMSGKLRLPQAEKNYV